MALEPNPYDQFDSDAPPGAAANPYDQFDNDAPGPFEPKKEPTLLERAKRFISRQIEPAPPPPLTETSSPLAETFPLPAPPPRPGPPETTSPLASEMPLPEEPKPPVEPPHLLDVFAPGLRHAIERALPEQSPGMPTVTGAAVAGIAHASREVGQTATGSKEVQPEESPAAKPIDFSGPVNLADVASKLSYQAGKSFPVLTGGIVGGGIGGYTTKTPAGALAGGAAGASLATVLQRLGPEYANELAATPNDPDGAYERAWTKTGIEAAGSGVGWALFGLTPFKGPIKNLLFQGLAIQPGVAAGTQAAQNVAAGRPVAEGTGEAAVQSAAQLPLLVAGHYLTVRPARNMAADAAAQAERDRAAGAFSGAAAEAYSDVPRLPAPGAEPGARSETPSETPPGVPPGARPADDLYPPPTAGRPLGEFLDDERKLSEIQKADEEAKRRAAAPPEAPKPPDGSRGAPAPADDPGAVEAARQRVEQPSPGQAEAGNYRKGHVDFQGLPVTIETPQGGERTGVGPDGKTWSVTMPHDYGYVKRTEGADEEPVDFLMGPNPKSDKIFVIDQADIHRPAFDEHKVLGGFDNVEQAADAYHRMFSDNRGGERLGGVTQMTVAEFKQALASRLFSKKVPLDRAGFAKSLAGLKARAVLRRKATTPRPSPSDDQSLLSLIRQLGGVKVKGPDGRASKEGQDYLAALGDQPRPGLVNNKGGGKTVEQMHAILRQRRWYVGTRDQGEDIQNFYDLVDRASHGEDVRHPELGPSPKAEQMADEHDEARARAQIERYGAEHATELTHEEVSAILELMRGGLDARDATIEYLERRAQRLIRQEQSGETNRPDLGPHGATAGPSGAEPEPEPELPGGGGPHGAPPPPLRPPEAPAGGGESKAGGGPAPEPEPVKPGHGESNKTYTKDRADAARERLRNRHRTQHNVGFDPEELADLITLAGFHVEGGLRKFAEFSKAMADDIGDWIRPGLLHLYRMIRDLHGFEGMQSDEEITKGEGPKAEPKGDYGTVDAPNRIALAEAIGNVLARGERDISTINEARKLAGELLGGRVEPGSATAKAVDEAIELGSIYATREIIKRAEGKPPAIYDQVLRLYERVPRLGVRTSTSMALQAYSTPLPLGYLAQQLAGVTGKTSVYEPTAGNGALLTAANPKLVQANEIDPERRAALESQGFRVTRSDASDEASAPRQKVDVVIANPPFGVRPGPGGESQVWDMGGGYRTTEIDHVISLNALAAMNYNGRAVLILGGLNKLMKTEEARSDGYNGKHKREFFLRLYSQYNVVDHFTVAGELHAQQGAGWPVDVIVIERRGKSQMALPAVDVPPIYRSWADLKEKLSGRERETTPQVVGQHTAAKAPKFARSFEEEPGAVDAQGKPLPQKVIPGAERLSPRELQRRQLLKATEGKKQGEPGQKAVTGLGMFGGEPQTTKKGGGQGSLFKISGEDLRSSVSRLPIEGGGWYEVSPEFAAHREGLRKQLQAELDRMNVPKAVQVVDRLFMPDGKSADGLDTEAVIMIALLRKEPLKTLRHEVVHALKRLGLFTDHEWNSLVAHANDKWGERYAKKVALYKPEERAEETIAFAAQDFERDREAGSMHGKGWPAIMQRLFLRMRNFIRAVRDLLVRSGFEKPEDIFERVMSGEVGARAKNRLPGPGSKFAAAWHGSPYDFEEFRNEKIGTGEGAQAYGYGHYFAGEKEVAEHYRQMTAPRRVDVGEIFHRYFPDAPTFGKEVYGRIFSRAHDNQLPENAARRLQYEFTGLRGFDSEKLASVVRDVKAAMKGRLYEVDLTPKDDEWLDWDRPIGEQSAKVQEQLAPLWDHLEKADRLDEYVEQKNADFGEWTGAELYRALMRKFAPPEQPEPAGTPRGWGFGRTGYEGQKAASAALARAGIPGIRYLDQGSRGGKGGGTSNYVVFDPTHIKVLNKFARSVEEGTETAEDRVGAAQNFLTRGQPFDRAFRIPFDIFGGIDEKGEWRPGQYITKRARGVIRDAKFSEDGRFSWMNGPLQTARAGLLDRYGQSEEYIERSRRVGLDKAKVEMKGAEVLRGLADRGVTSDEAKMLQAILTGEQIPDEQWQRVAQPIRDVIDQLGAEAVHLGLVSAESYERNRGTYLHRVYLKDEANHDHVTAWVSQFFKNRRTRIIGDELKGRGLFMEVGKESLVKDLEGFMEAKRGEPQKGDMIRVLDKFGETAGLPGIGAPRQGRPIRRVFVDADKPTPEKFSDYTDRGTWEIRQVRSGDYVLWRDYTKAERTNMGEILDARYTIAKTFGLMANDLAVGRFYKDVAENGEWTRNQQPNTKWVTPAQYGRGGSSDVDWVQVPDTAIPKSGGKKKWGALAGKYVRAEIWRDLNELDLMQKRTWWSPIVTQWKLNKTARSPIVHMNNVISNVVLMDLADVRAQDLIAGVRSYHSGDAHYIEARDAGAFGADLMSQEVRRTILEPILEEIKRQRVGELPADETSKAMDVVNKMLNGLWSTLRRGQPFEKLDRWMIDAYRIEDEIFRMALYRRRRAQGATPEQAARDSREQFVDYDIRAPWVNALRRTVLPFASWSYRIIPRLAKSIALRPWKLAKYFALAYGAGALGYMLSPGNEDEERRSLRPDQQGYTWMGVPRMMRMPYRDQWGNPVFLDTRRWVPSSDVFDMNQGNSAVPFPAWLNFGGPILMAAELYMNKDAFTGDPIVDPLTDDAWDQTTKLGDWGWKQWAPSAAWTPGSFYWTRVSNALGGATDRRGTPESVAGALASSVGVKVKGEDVDLNFAYRGLEFRKRENDLRGQARILSTQHEEGKMSDGAYKSALSHIFDKLENLHTEETRTMLGDEAANAVEDVKSGKLAPEAGSAILQRATDKATASKAERARNYVPRPPFPGQAPP